MDVNVLDFMPPSIGSLPTPIAPDSWGCILYGKVGQRGRILWHAEPWVFCLCREELLPAERALGRVRRCTADEQGFFTALDRYLCPNRAAQTSSGVRAGKSCPLREPLVESVEPTLFVHAAQCSQDLPQKASDTF